MTTFIKAKSNLNLGIDIIMFLLMMPIAGIGFLMKYVLVPGYKRNELFGDSIDLEFLGFDRHQWGTLHFVLSLIFLLLLVLHLVLHWKMIISFFQRMIPGKTLRIGAYIFISVFSLSMILYPFFLAPEKVLHQPHYRNRNIQPHHRNKNLRMHLSDRNGIYNDSTNTHAASDSSHRELRGRNNIEDLHSNEEYNEYEVYGYMTLQSVADRYGVPISVITKDLNIKETSADEKLGWLRKKYNFTMTDVRRSLHNYLNKK